MGSIYTRKQTGREAVVSADASEYASGVIKLISSPTLRSELARNGRDYVRTWHNPEKALAPLVDAFEKVRGARKASPKSRASALRNLDEPLRRLVPETIRRCLNDEVKTVALYGAGSHTRLLVPIWQALGGPAMRSIIETGETSEAHCIGFPVVSAGSFDPSEVDAIVLSSHGYEQEMAAVCSECWPGVRVFP